MVHSLGFAGKLRRSSSVARRRATTHEADLHDDQIHWARYSPASLVAHYTMRECFRKNKRCPLVARRWSRQTLYSVRAVH